MGKYPPVNNYEAKSFKTVTPGDYDLIIESINDRDKNGNPYMDKNGMAYELFIFDVVDEDATVFERFCFDTENPYADIQLGKFKQLLVSCGLDPSQSGKTDDLIGKTCRAFIKVKTGKDGVVRNTIVEYKTKTNEPTTTTQHHNDNDLPF